MKVVNNEDNLVDIDIEQNVGEETEEKEVKVEPILTEDLGQEAELTVETGNEIEAVQEMVKDEDDQVQEIHHLDILLGRETDHRVPILNVIDLNLEVAILRLIVGEVEVDLGKMTNPPHQIRITWTDCHR